MSDDPIQAEISKVIWHSKYRWQNNGDEPEGSIAASWRRVARALAALELKDKQKWEEIFFSSLCQFKFLPGGRILANAGTAHRATLFNCFVMGQIEDSMDGIFDALKEGALTMQYGGGVGYDFSSLRPKGSVAKSTGRIASGPVSFMRIWNTMCDTILTFGARRGAMMSTLRCDHPDIEDFISAKQKPGELNHFNLSVLITDEFIRAVRENKQWELVFPQRGEQCSAVYKSVSARGLWDKILRTTYEYSEPGVLFIDQINRFNNLSYCENISATNPCGEIPLPPYGACDLGSLNLTQFIADPFTENARFEWDELKRQIPICVRLLDNVIEASQFPLKEQREQAYKTRRIGLGVTGLADALVMLSLHYGSQEARLWASEVMKVICHGAYEASIELAKEKGAFPYFEKDRYLKSRFIKTLPDSIITKIEKFGIRNSHLLAIAPTGTISLLANNISSGIEPIFSLEYSRNILQEEIGRAHV